MTLLQDIGEFGKTNKGVKMPSTIKKISDEELEETKEVKTYFAKVDLLKSEAGLNKRLEEVRDMLKLFDEEGT